jgi:hypothetical protein
MENKTDYILQMNLEKGTVYESKTYEREINGNKN